MTVAIPEQLRLDPTRATQAIVEALRAQVGTVLRRSGLVVAMSGGIDSSVCAALAVQAVGPKRVLGLALPERESGRESLALAKELAMQLGIELLVEDISPALVASGCYARRDAAIQRIVPEYGEGWRCKLLAENGGLDSDRLNVAYLAIQPPGEELRKVRLPAREFREIVAATNFKQRIRKMLEHHHADRLHYAVVGTPNRLEYELGFFVKGGDGLADVKPIAHLYKTQVYALADALGVPSDITSRTPTTDTYSLPQTQEEFYFSLPTATMDAMLHAHDRGLDAATAAAELGFSTEQVERTYREIEQKRSTTRYLHLSPMLVEAVPGVTAIEEDLL